MPSALQRFSVRPVDPQREQRERHRNRQHQHDHDRLQEALELRRQHHVDEDHRQADRHDQVGGGLVEDLRLALQPERHGRRHVQPGQHLAHVVRRLVERVAGRHVGVEADTVNCRFERCSVVGPRPRSIRAMLSMRTGPFADGTVSRPISSMSRALILEHPDLDRVLLLSLPCRTRSGRRRTPPAAACCRPSTCARRGRRRACDRRRRALRGSRCSG